MAKTYGIPSAVDLGITGSQERLVYECLARGGCYTLSDIGLYLLREGHMSRETSISARIRDLNRRLRPNGWEINWQYKNKGSNDTIYCLDEM